MRESDMRQIVVKSLKGLDAMSVENPAKPGTPDVNYIGGWIELKILEAWPVHHSTKIKVACFTPQQRVWLRRRSMMGGKAFFLIKIARDWLLFEGGYAGENIGKLTKAEMLTECIMHCEGGLDGWALNTALKK